MNEEEKSILATGLLNAYSQMFSDLVGQFIKAAESVGIDSYGFADQMEAITSVRGVENAEYARGIELEFQSSDEGLTFFYGTLADALVNSEDDKCHNLALNWIPILDRRNGEWLAPEGK